MAGAESRLGQGSQPGLRTFSEKVQRKLKSEQSEGVIEDWEKKEPSKPREHYMQRA